MRAQKRPADETFVPRVRYQNKVQKMAPEIEPLFGLKTGPTFHSICGRVVVLCLGLSVHGCVQGEFVCIPCPREGPQKLQKKSQKCGILRARFGGQKMAPFLGPLYFIVNKRAHFGVHFLDPKMCPRMCPKMCPKMYPKMCPRVRLVSHFGRTCFTGAI